MFKFDNLVFDFEYDIILKLEEVFLFLLYGFEKGLVWIYYVFLLEWLISEINKGKFYYVKK